MGRQTKAKQRRREMHEEVAALFDLYLFRDSGRLDMMSKKDGKLILRFDGANHSWWSPLGAGGQKGVACTVLDAVKIAVKLSVLTEARM
jgi:hypothetical protein